MTFDLTNPDNPRRRPSLGWRGRVQRRDVLRGGLWLSLGASAAPLLSACGSDSGPAAAGDYPLARPDSPVTLPITDANPPIGDGLSPETGGVLNILNYNQYMAPSVMNDFGDMYGVDVQVTPFANYDEMLNKLNQSGAAFDLCFPDPSVLSRMVFSDLIQPFNKSYIPNITNTWPEYQDPWYDQKAQYTVPYTVYTTGIGYRVDRDVDPSPGYKMLWDSAYAGKVSVLDDSRESLAMAMLAWGITDDINTDNADYINAAKDKLIDLIDLVDVQTGVSGYAKIPEGVYTVAQCWSGDMMAGQYYLPKDETPDVLGYWVPESSAERVTTNDCMCIPKSSKKPVLAHMMINALLDNDISLQNLSWNGYQPPLTKLSPQFLIDEGFIPENLTNAVVLPADFKDGLAFYEVTPQVENAWLAAFREFTAGGS